MGLAGPPDVLFKSRRSVGYRPFTLSFKSPRSAGHRPALAVLSDRNRAWPVPLFGAFVWWTVGVGLCLGCSGWHVMLCRWGWRDRPMSYSNRVDQSDTDLSRILFKAPRSAGHRPALAVLSDRKSGLAG